MAPTATKKGTQARPSSSRTDRRSASRHSTPLTDPGPTTPLTTTPSAPGASSAPTLVKETPYLRTPTSALISSDLSIEALIDRSNVQLSKNGDPPSARELHVIHNKIRDNVAKSMEHRNNTSNASLRQLMTRKKQNEKEQEAAREEEERIMIKREEAEKKKKDKKAISRKRSHDEMELDSIDEQDKKDILPSVGAHGLARQDGVGVHEGVVAPPSPPVPAGTVAPDPLDVAESPSDSEDPRAEPPSTAPLYERIFGKDPTAADDPIIYDIRDLRDDMTDDEKQAILNVAQWPESDLRHLTAGDPPDMDFSNAKPASQVNFSTFQTYIEPFIRPYTEEDVGFLKERGDRDLPYLVPQRGSKGYKDVWAAEDGDAGILPPQRHITNPNEARGSMEDLDDEIADQDSVSMGPSMSRMLSLFRAQATTTKKEDSEDVNGDISMVNGDNDGGAEASQAQNWSSDDLKPATALPSDMPRPANLPQLDYESFEARALQELKYIGIIAPDERPEYDLHNDDEVAARLRTLQHELRNVSRINNIRKARVLELVLERLAMQEYSSIADDLDNQVNSAYLKRNRSLIKPNHKKGASHQARPGQKGVAMGVGGRGVSDGVRALMQKRRRWIDEVGLVVDHGRPPIPEEGETIFDEASMKRLEKVEREAELESVDADAE